jgi:hypothetical protein
MSGRSKDIIFLVGAGASAEASIPTSGEMIGKIETLLTGRNSDWYKFHALYNHVKSAIHFSAGIKGLFREEVPYNIEILVNTLYELERNEEHPLYPFIASWNSRFVALAKEDFSGVKDFRRLILKELKKWMCPEDPSLGDYYSGFVVLQRHLNYPLHLFSLNYDLCVERLHNKDFRVETEFEGFGPKYVWDWERFEYSDSGPNPPPQILLYKLHGSINWKRNDESKNLFCVEQIESIEPDRMELIFGRDFKLEAADPYLFYAYEFRRFALSAELIVVIGYGFGDPHINKMLTQSVRDDSNRRLLVVSCNKDEKECAEQKNLIAQRLEVSPDQIISAPGTAKTFLEQQNLGMELMKLIPRTKEAPF